MTFNHSFRSEITAIIWPTATQFRVSRPPPGLRCPTWRRLDRACTIAPTVGLWCYRQGTDWRPVRRYAQAHGLGFESVRRSLCIPPCTPDKKGYLVGAAFECDQHLDGVNLGGVAHSVCHPRVRGLVLLSSLSASLSQYRSSVAPALGPPKSSSGSKPSASSLVISLKGRM